MRAERTAAAGLGDHRDSVRRWTNLLIAAIAFFWLAQAAFDLAWGNVFGRLAIDAASFWSAGYIANHFGYASVYDLQVMAQVQRPLIPDNPASAFVFHPIPTPYLPVFLLPFQLMALLPPIPAAIIWILANAVGIIVYLRAFVRRMTGQPLALRSLALVVVSAPVFIDLFTGQVNLLLMIGVGEFILAWSHGKSLHAGLWLGLLLIKPQFLILLAPALLLQRQFRTIVGLALSSALAVGLSFLLSGPGASLALWRLWLGYSAGAGLPSNDMSLMMNWRMLGLLLSAFLPSSWASLIVWLGMIVTVIAALALWARPLRVGSPMFLAALLGLLAATGAVAWHSHVHSAMLVIPVLLILQAEPRYKLGHLLEWWSLLPSSLYLVRFLLAALLQVGILPHQAAPFVDFLAGIGLFIMNLVILTWAVRQHGAPTPSPAQIQSLS